MNDQEIAKEFDIICKKCKSNGTISIREAWGIVTSSINCSNESCDGYVELDID